MATDQPVVETEMAAGEMQAPAPYDVEGKVAVVTGAGSGINLSFTTLLLSRGCSVLLADLSLRPEAQTLLSQYSTKAPNKPRAIFLKTDVTDWTQLNAMFTTAEREFGHIDIVCPGAGVFEPLWSNFWKPPGSKDSKDTLDAGRYRSLDINLVHPIRTTQIALSHFLQSQSNSHSQPSQSPPTPKRIVITSSIAGQIATLAVPMYIAAKHGINGFVRSLAALEPRLGVRVNAVAPGIIRTPLWLERPEKLKMFEEGTDEWVEPEEVAGAMLRCLEDPDLIGGTVLEVGKGQTRKVEAFNDPGPSGKGHMVSKMGDAYEDVFNWLGEDGWGKV